MLTKGSGLIRNLLHVFAGWLYHRFRQFPIQTAKQNCNKVHMRSLARMTKHLKTEFKYILVCVKTNYGIDYCYTCVLHAHNCQRNSDRSELDNFPVKEGPLPRLLLQIVYHFYPTLFCFSSRTWITKTMSFSWIEISVAKFSKLWVATFIFEKIT